MTGGPRRNSGRPADPNALRRDRKDDADWSVLPAEGFSGDVPDFPLERISVFDIYFEDKKRVKEFDLDGTVKLRQREIALWEDLWAKPQAFMWAKLGLKYEVAAYVRAFIESTGEDSNAGLKTAALRMSAEIGLSLPGMHSLRWKFSEDELTERRQATTPRTAPTMKNRLAAVSGD